jgi:hypothetical protein
VRMAFGKRAAAATPPTISAGAQYFGYVEVFNVALLPLRGCCSSVLRREVRAARERSSCRRQSLLTHLPTLPQPHATGRLPQLRGLGDSWP